MDRKEAQRVIDEHQECTPDFCEDPEQLREALRVLGQVDA